MYLTPGLASSPHGAGFKRTVSARATGSSLPVAASPFGGRTSTSLLDDLPMGWMSGSTRRTPTPSGVVHSKESVNPAAVVVGFNIEQQQVSQFQPAEEDLQQGPASLRAGTVSLLSRALGAPSIATMERLPSLEGGDYFQLEASGVDCSLLTDLQERHSVFSSELCVTAFMLAAKVHAGQQRKDGTSQLSHCVMTALQLAELGLDQETVAAGLLHEVLRCAPMSRCHVEEFMPSRVVQLVDRVTTISEISQLYRQNKDALGEEKMRRMLLAMEDVRAVLIKLACRVHNMKTLSALPADKQRAFAQETLDVFSVVANRLGIWSLKAELEDLAFSVLHPEEYDRLRAQVARRQDPDALEATINRIKTSLDARGVKYEDISGRPKSLYGIWCKMREGNIANLDQVYDVTALRVVVTNKHDCYVALRCIQEVYRCMAGRSKDYIKDERKSNGYQSLHETIYGEDGLPVEVQIRTHKMHYIAEFGFAAHWKYKEKLSNEDKWLDKEVQYKKWLTTYKLGLHDKKVRASGAAPRETALHSLGMHLLDGRGDAGPEDPRVDPFLRHERFRLQAPLKQHVSIVLQTQDTIESRSVPLAYPAAQLAQDLRIDQLPGYVLTVNKRIPGADVMLRDGDLVQVVMESVARAHTSPGSTPVGTPPSPAMLAPFQQAAAQQQVVSPRVRDMERSFQQQGGSLFQPQSALFGTQGPTSPPGSRPPLPTMRTSLLRKALSHQPGDSTHRQQQQQHQHHQYEQQQQQQGLQQQGIGVAARSLRLPTAVSTMGPSLAPVCT